MRLLISLEKRQDKHIAQLWPQRMNQELFTVQLKASATCLGFFSVCVNFHFAYNTRQQNQQNLENARTPPRRRSSHKDLCFIFTAHCIQGRLTLHSKRTLLLQCSVSKAPICIRIVSTNLVLKGTAILGLLISTIAFSFSANGQFLQETI